jgi:hypothetical protein
VILAGLYKHIEAKKRRIAKIVVESVPKWARRASATCMISYRPNAFRRRKIEDQEWWKKMVKYYVVSKSRMVRIPCEGPLDAQIESLKLEEEMKAAGYKSGVEVQTEASNKPARRARPDVAFKRNSKLRSK